MRSKKVAPKVRASPSKRQVVTALEVLYEALDTWLHTTKQGMDPDAASDAIQTLSRFTALMDALDGRGVLITQPAAKNTTRKNVFRTNDLVALRELPDARRILRDLRKADRRSLGSDANYVAQNNSLAQQLHEHFHERYPSLSLEKCVSTVEALRERSILRPRYEPDTPLREVHVGADDLLLLLVDARTGTLKRFNSQAQERAFDAERVRARVDLPLLLPLLFEALGATRTPSWKETVAIAKALGIAMKPRTQRHRAIASKLSPLLSAADASRGRLERLRRYV